MDLSIVKPYRTLLARNLPLDRASLFGMPYPPHPPLSRNESQSGDGLPGPHRLCQAIREHLICRSFAPDPTDRQHSC